jgi:MFS transporter, DHA1 family, inner membrane transport protein
LKEMSSSDDNTAVLDRRVFSAILFSRLALNMQMRVIYPFLPAISRGLGVPLETTSLLLTARAVANLSSPLYGVLSDRYGRRVLMLAGLLILALGSLLVLVAPSLALIMAAIAFLSLSKAVYDPAVLAYLGDRIPYHRRGRTMGILAMMWPASWLVGVPLAGFLINDYGWRAPFVLICILGVIALTVTWRMKDIGAAAPPAVYSSTTTAGEPWRVWLRSRLAGIGGPAWAMLLVTLCQILAIENVYIVYGAWLEERFALSAISIGLASIIIAVAEFSAEGASAGWVDRIGKRRAVLGALLLSLAAYLLLPVVSGSLVGALVGLFFLWLAFDFGIVSTLPLISELAPQARGTLMALNVAAMATARLIASLFAARLWNAGGLSGSTLVSAVVIALALLLLLTRVTEQKVLSTNHYPQTTV